MNKFRLTGLYAVTPDLENTAQLLAMVRSALAGGARLVQYRNKTADENLRHKQALALRGLCQGFGAKLIINDHVRLAESIDADGVHVGADDSDVAEARRLLGPAKIIGASCYRDPNSAKIAAAQGADYVAFGSFFASSVKPGAVRAPLTILRSARLQMNLPVFAIGGITLANAGDLIHEGADAIAVISALFFASDIEATARQFCQLFEDKAA